MSSLKMLSLVTMLVVGTANVALQTSYAAQPAQPYSISQPATASVPQAQRVAAVQTYRLKTGNVESIATFDGRTLVIHEGSQQHQYSRMETLDSRDGQHLGFYNRALDKTIRFPTAAGGRIQVEGAYKNWHWSQMTVTPIVSQVATPAQPQWQMHKQIDERALKLQQQSQSISSEANLHYRNTPEFAHLITDTSEVKTHSKRLHDLAHLHASPAQLAAEAQQLDTAFHHLEETFARIESSAAHGHGHVHGPTSHVKQLLDSMETNLHQIEQHIATLQRHTVLRPIFGSFANTENLAHQLETAANAFLLDMYHNFSHNVGFKETYAEAYQILTVAKNVESLAHRHDHLRIQQALAGMDQLVHHLDDDIENWTDRHGHANGQVVLDKKLHLVEDALKSLLNDAGVRATAVAPGPGIAPPPQP